MVVGAHKKVCFFCTEASSILFVTIKSFFGLFPLCGDGSKSRFPLFITRGKWPQSFLCPFLLQSKATTGLSLNWTQSSFTNFTAFCSTMLRFFILCTVPGTKSRNKMGEMAVSFLVYCTPVTGVAVHQRLTLFFTTLTHRIGALSSPPVSQRGKYCRRGWRLSRKYIAMAIWCFSIILRRTTCGFRSKKSLWV